MYRRVSLALVAGALVVGLTPSGAAAQEIEGQYIVVLKEQAKRDTAKRKVRDRGGKVQREFSRVLNGFSAKLDSKALAEVRKDPAVAYVEPDRVITLDATQQNPTWGLDRIDQRARPLSATYTYDNTASDVTAYIIDTGIRTTHADFGGRAVSGFDAIDALPADDCNGHGTHVAGTVGSNTYGVAKGVRLVAVRVLNCSGSGSTSGVIAGIDWVTANHTSGLAVANMSLGGGASTALDNAVRRSVADGVTYAVAAGNESQNACNVSPARTGEAITVGATTSTDARASYSNYGSCVDIFAPGSSITSTWHTSTTNTISGTSMASPHVAGAAALYLQANQTASPATVATALSNAATTGVVTNPGSGSPNRLLFTGPSSTPTPPTSCAAQAYTGSLTASRQSAYPAGTSFTAAAGAHKGCLTGPASADFDLYLERWNGASWGWVARGIGETSTETVTYTGAAGTYRWRVYSYSGTGAFRLEVTRP